MTTSLIYSARLSTPATHVLVVGVGAYPHLRDGTGALYSEHQGMGQLSSPALSAVAVANWFIDQFECPALGDDPARPLGTLRLVTRVPDDSTLSTRNGPRPEGPLPPSMANFIAAANAWKNDADHRDDTLIFYFCGHGIADGAATTLLMEDYGADPDNALSAALDFGKFHLGLERCDARRQIYFVDACRVADASLTAAGGYGGQPVFQPTARRNGAIGPRHKPALYSTFEGDSAQSRTNQVSLFTSALLTALDGGGADNTRGEWWIDPLQLQKSIQFQMEREYENGFPASQVNPADYATDFALHRVPGQPKVPVQIGCRPEELNKTTTLSWNDGQASASRAPRDNDWDTTLTTGSYTFEASLGGSPPYSLRTWPIRPPYREILLRRP